MLSADPAENHVWFQGATGLLFNCSRQAHNCADDCIKGYDVSTLTLSR